MRPLQMPRGNPDHLSTARASRWGVSTWLTSLNREVLSDLSPHNSFLSFSAEQLLRDLHRVQRSALAQLVARDIQRQGPARRVADVLADAPDEDLVLAARVHRHRKIV